MSVAPETMLGMTRSFFVRSAMKWQSNPWRGSVGLPWLARKASKVSGSGGLARSSDFGAALQAWRDAYEIQALVRCADACFFREHGTFFERRNSHHCNYVKL